MSRNGAQLGSARDPRQIHAILRLVIDNEHLNAVPKPVAATDQLDAHVHQYRPSQRVGRLNSAARTPVPP